MMIYIIIIQIITYLDGKVFELENDKTKLTQR